MALPSTPVKIYLPPEDHAKLKAIAEAEDRTVTTLIRRMVREYLAGRDSSVAA